MTGSEREGLRLRPAADADVEAVRALFRAAYGDDYPFRQFYDPGWLRRAVYDDDTLFLVAGEEGAVTGAVSVMLDAGGLGDLVGEFGRLVVDPACRGRGVGTALCAAALARVAPVLRFGFAEARTAHDGSQKILERTGFAPLGFEPAKYRLHDRESVVLYGTLPAGTELRRNHPRLIPEAAPLAMAVLEGLGLPQDVVVVDDEEGWPGAASGPGGGECAIEELDERGWSPLLRIERGRARSRELFGNLSLSQGFFKIKNEASRYLVARRGGAVLGGLGYTHDPVDAKVRFFELIGFDDAVKGALLREAERTARETLGARYVEADVSAHAPALQRTLERLGFVPVAYCPSMVFEEVERLDVVRMARLTAPCFREDIPLTPAAAGVRLLVERALADRREGGEVAAAAGGTSLFAGLEDGEIAHLARRGRIRTIPAGEVVLRRGARDDRLFIVISGSLSASVDGREVGRIGPGGPAGEMALVDPAPRCADVTAREETRVAEFRRDELYALMARRPRLGMTVLGNLAAAMAGRLRAADGEEGR